MEPRGSTAALLVRQNAGAGSCGGHPQAKLNGQKRGTPSCLLAGCVECKELADSQGAWPAAQREGLKAEVQRLRSGRGGGKAQSLGWECTKGQLHPVRCPQ